VDKHSAHITNSPVTAKDKTLMRNKLGHLEENARLFANKGVLARFYNSAFPCIIFIWKGQKFTQILQSTFIVEFVEAKLDQRHQ